MRTPDGWKDGAWSPWLAWPTFPRARPPLSPRLLLLPLPRDVNSLKLLIKNILLSPPKICFPVIFLLGGEIGGRGWWARSGGQAFLGLHGETRGAKSWRRGGTGCPLPWVTISGSPALPRETFLRTPSPGVAARFGEGHQLPACTPTTSTESLKTTAACAHMHRI